MPPPDHEDTPIPVSPEEDPAAAVIKDRPGGRSGGAARNLDQAMRDARNLKVALPHHRLEVDERAVRRAVRWGKADDHRSATLDEVMKQRRQAERMVQASLAELEAGPDPDAAPTAPAPGSGLGKQVMIWSIVLAVLVIGVMVVVAIKLM